MPKLLLKWFIRQLKKGFSVETLKKLLLILLGRQAAEKLAEVYEDVFGDGGRGELADEKSIEFGLTPELLDEFYKMGEEEGVSPDEVNAALERFQAQMELLKKKKGELYNHLNEKNKELLEKLNNAETLQEKLQIFMDAYPDIDMEGQFAAFGGYMDEMGKIAAARSASKEKVKRYIRGGATSEEYRDSEEHVRVEGDRVLDGSDYEGELDQLPDWARERVLNSLNQGLNDMRERLKERQELLEDAEPRERDSIEQQILYLEGMIEKYVELITSLGGTPGRTLGGARGRWYRRKWRNVQPQSNTIERSSQSTPNPDFEQLSGSHPMSACEAGMSDAAAQAVENLADVREGLEDLHDACAAVGECSAMSETSANLDALSSSLTEADGAMQQLARSTNALSDAGNTLSRVEAEEQAQADALVQAHSAAADAQRREADAITRTSLARAGLLTELSAEHTATQNLTAATEELANVRTAANAAMEATSAADALSRQVDLTQQAVTNQAAMNAGLQEEESLQQSVLQAAEKVMQVDGERLAILGAITDQLLQQTGLFEEMGESGQMMADSLGGALSQAMEVGLRDGLEGLGGMLESWIGDTQSYLSDNPLTMFTQNIIGSVMGAGDSGGSAYQTLSDILSGGSQIFDLLGSSGSSGSVLDSLLGGLGLGAGSGGGGVSAGSLGSLFGGTQTSSVDQWIGQNIAGASSSFNTGIPGANPSGMFSSVAPTQAIGGVANVGMGAYQLASGGGSTASLIQGASSIAAGVLAFTPAAPIAPLVAVAGSLIGGMIGGSPAHDPYAETTVSFANGRWDAEDMDPVDGGESEPLARGARVLAQAVDELGGAVGAFDLSAIAGIYDKGDDYTLRIGDWEKTGWEDDDVLGAGLAHMIQQGMVDGVSSAMQYAVHNAVTDADSDHLEVVLDAAKFTYESQEMFDDVYPEPEPKEIRGDFSIDYGVMASEFRDAAAKAERFGFAAADVNAILEDLGAGIEDIDVLAQHLTNPEGGIQADLAASGGTLTAEQVAEYGLNPDLLEKEGENYVAAFDDLTLKMLESFVSARQRMRDQWEQGISDALGEFTGDPAASIRGIEEQFTALWDDAKALTADTTDLNQLFEETVTALFRQTPIQYRKAILEMDGMTDALVEKLSEINREDVANYLSDLENAFNITEVLGSYEEGIRSLDETLESALDSFENYGLDEAEIQNRYAEAVDKLRKSFEADFDAIAEGSYEPAGYIQAVEALDALAEQAEALGYTAQEATALMDTALRGLQASLASNIEEQILQLENPAQAMIAAVREEMNALRDAANAIGLSTDRIDYLEELRLAELMVNNRNQLLQAYESEAAEIQRMIDQVEALADSLAQAKINLRLDDSLSPLTPVDQVSDARAHYDDIRARAQAGDLEAMAELDSAGRSYLSNLLDVHSLASSEYANAFNYVLDGLTSAETVAQQELATQRAQLQMLQLMLEQLGIIVDQTAGNDAEEAFNAALNTYAMGLTENPYATVHGVQGTQTNQSVIDWLDNLGYRGSLSGGAAVNWLGSQGLFDEYVDFINDPTGSAANDNGSESIDLSSYLSAVNNWASTVGDNPYGTGNKTSDQVVSWFQERGYSGDFGGGAGLRWAGDNDLAAQYLNYIGVVDQYLDMWASAASDNPFGTGRRSTTEVLNWLGERGYNGLTTGGAALRWLGEQGIAKEYLDYINRNFLGSDTVGFATGGSFTVAGPAGADNLMLPRLRVTAGEIVNVSRGDHMADVLSELRAMRNDNIILLDRLIHLEAAAGQGTHERLDRVASAAESQARARDLAEARTA